MVQVTQQQINSGRWKLIDGVWHKLCSGSAHEEPEWLPATPKYYYFRKSNGRPLANCRLCHVWDKVKNPGSHHGFVPIVIARPFYVEAVNRIGMTELSRRSGLSLHHLQSIYLRPGKKYVRKLSLRKVMLELVSMHRKSEFNHSPRVQWQTQRRNNGSAGTCGGCGGSRDNITDSCSACYDRNRRWFKEGKITEKRWEAIKIKHFPNGRNLILGVLHS